MEGRTSHRTRVLRVNVLALALYAVFAATAFGWRTWVQWQRTGDTGLRMSATPGSRQWRAKLGFIAALIAGLAAPIAGLAGIETNAVLDHNGLRYTGAAIALIGILLTGAAQWQMGESWRIGVDPTEHTTLVTNGVFGVVRNPIFTAMVINAIGLTLLVANNVAVVGLVALIVALEIQVRLVEEPYLRTTHGGEYTNYAARAGRFLPGIGRQVTPPQHPEPPVHRTDPHASA